MHCEPWNMDRASWTTRATFFEIAVQRGWFKLLKIFIITIIKKWGGGYLLKKAWVRSRDYEVREHIPVPHDNLFQSILSFAPLFLDSSPWPRGWFDITFIGFSYVQHGPVFSTCTGTFSTLFKIKVFRFIDKLDVYYRRHFLKAEQQSDQLRHHDITTDQLGVFPKIASQS